MEDFIDYILFLLLLIVLGITGLLIFLLFNSPRLAYALVVILFLGTTGGIGVWVRKIFRKKRLGAYYPLFLAISQSKKEIIKSVKKLNRDLRSNLPPLFPKLNKLCMEVQQCIWKLQDIDNTLASLEAKKHSERHQRHQPLRTSPKVHKESTRAVASSNRYYENIRAIETSRQRYLQQIQEVLQFLQEFNSHLLALRYAHSTFEVDSDITETLDELLIELKTLEEIL